MSNVPTVKVDKAIFDNTVTAVDFVTTITGFVGGKSEARRLIDQGGITIGDKKPANFAEPVTLDVFADGYVILKKGKKNFLKVEI